MYCSDPFYLSRDLQRGMLTWLKFSALLLPLGKFPSPLFSYDELGTDIWTAETFMDKCGYPAYYSSSCYFLLTTIFFLLEIW